MIAHIVPIRVIDLLEKIDIEHQQRKDALVTRAYRDEPVQFTLKVMAVRQTSERVIREERGSEASDANRGACDLWGELVV